MTGRPAPCACLALAATLAGCTADYSLLDVPIRGGTEEQRQIVRAELDRTAAWLGTDYVRLSGVRLRALRGMWGGYHVGKRLILVDPDGLPTQYIHRVVRHEVGHAVDYQARLRQGGGHDFRSAYDLLGPPGGSAHGDFDDENAEGFAELFELGPLVMGLAASECGPEPAPVVEHRDLFVEEVWQGLLPASRDVVAVFQLPPGETLGGIQTYDGRYLDVAFSSSLDWAVLDLQTMTWSDRRPGSAEQSGYYGPSTPDPAQPGMWTTRGEGGIAATAKADAGIFGVPDSEFPGYVVRSHATGGEWAWLDPPCMTPDDQLFVAGGEAGMVWEEDGKVYVAFVVP